MKYLLSTLSFLFLASTAFADLQPSLGQTHTGELGWVDEQIRAIIPARIGVGDREISSLRDPFKYTKPEPVARVTPTLNLEKYFSIKKAPVVIKVAAPKPPLVLSLIINSKALISGKWYKVGENVDGYSIKSIGTTSVTLANSKSVKTLSIKSDNYLKINTK